MLFALLWWYGAAHAAGCPADAPPRRIDGVEVCARSAGGRTLVVTPGGVKVEAGTVDGGHRQGWWTRWSPAGEVLGETRYQAGVPVDGLQAPPDRPRCLADPPPDGLYQPPAGVEPCGDRLGCVASPLSRPVAVVGGCIGTTPGPDGDDGVGVTGRNRFVVVHHVGAGCASGVTVEYRATPSGLTGQAQRWTTCGTEATRDDDPRPLRRSVPLDGAHPAALLADGRPAVHRAALEAIAHEQPAKWTCAPLGKAIGGVPFPDLADRAMQVAAEPCLADPLHTLLQQTYYPLAAAALARITNDPGTLAGDVLSMVRAGDAAAAADFAGRLATLKGADPGLRDGLAGLLLDPRGGPPQRAAAAEALDRLFPAATDGTALLAKARHAPCAGLDKLFGLAAVRADLSGVPPAEMAPTFRPLLGTCDPALDEITGLLLADLQRARGAPDAAWAVLVTALRRRPGPGWTDTFPGLACGTPLPATWSRHRRQAMGLLRARRCTRP